MGVGNGAAMMLEPCPHRDDHGQIQADLVGLRRDVDDHKGSIGDLFRLARESADAVAETQAGIARIEGSLEGALRAKKVSGALLGVLLSVAGSAIVALLLALIRASGKAG